VEILSPDSTSSAAFVIASGKQITLSAKGLTGTDTVVVEILELSSAPDFTGNPCCDLQKSRIEVVRRTPLLCPNGTAVALTAAYPWGVLDSPQGVTLGVRLVADPAALVSVELNESAADSCMTCICDKPCVDAQWKITGDTRCSGTNIEAKEVSNCGTVRWTVTGPQTWVASGTVRCRNGRIENEEANDCDKKRWVDAGPVVWTATGETRCRNGKVEAEEATVCNDKRWTPGANVTWTATGQTRCENNLVENEEANNCGELRWTATATLCGFCPSVRMACDGSPGYAFHDSDIRDPAATVSIDPCPGDTSFDRMWIYPSAGPGHTIKVRICGELLGYAANCSDCACN
jgi:hypothetical protein